MNPRKGFLPFVFSLPQYGARLNGIASDKGLNIHASGAFSLDFSDKQAAIPGGNQKSVPVSLADSSRLCYIALAGVVSNNLWRKQAQP